MGVSVTAVGKDGTTKTFSGDRIFFVNEDSFGTVLKAEEESGSTVFLYPGNLLTAKVEYSD